MTEEPPSEDGSSVISVESLPGGGLSWDQYRTLEGSDAIEIAAPVVMEKGSNRVTHLDLVVNDTHYYVGWNPGEEQWERILVVSDPEDEDSATVESSVSVFDDESAEAELLFDAGSDPSNEDIVEFIWEYVEYTYPDTSGLRNIMDEAVEKLDEG